MGLRGQQLKIEPQYITVRHHFHHFAWKKTPSDSIFRLLNIIRDELSFLAHQKLLSMTLKLLYFLETRFKLTTQKKLVAVTDDLRLFAISFEKVKKG